MKTSQYGENGPAALHLVEQAVHLLRGNLAILAWYYLGSVPFGLAFLFFCADMSRSAFAEEKLAGTALLVAGTYLWMKFWHSIFAQQLHATLFGGKPPPLRLGRASRIFMAQAALQPTALFLLPVSLLAVLPFGWVSAFYQTLSVLGESESGRIRPLIRAAVSQAMLWPRQNHVLLLVFSGFTLVVFLNWSSATFLLPGLVKMFLGYESVFTRGGWAMLNTTFFMAMACLTFLTVDPIRKAVYVLRSFYAHALSSGEDIKAELQLLTASARDSILEKPMGCVVIMAFTLLGFSAAAADLDAGAASQTGPAKPSMASAATSAQPLGASVDPVELDAAIRKVIDQPRFAWRLPREAPRETEQGIVARFLERVRETLREWAQGVWRWLDKWLKRLFQRSAPSGKGGVGWISHLELLAMLVAGLIVVGIGLLILRLLQAGRHRAEVISQPLQNMPDLADENLRADQLPEDGWLRLANELLERGELRLAMRAFYLASLAHLAERGLITIARFKSNLDYYRELRRRAHAFPGLCELFDANTSVFERVWYGNRSVEAGQVGEFADNVRQMKEAPAV